MKGTSASQLMARWAKSSSKEKYCGRVDYTWYRGSGETLSCIKSSWRPQYDYVANPWTGQCVVTGVTMNWSMSMPIARWSGPDLVPHDLVTWWKARQRSVRDHEARHVAIYRQWIPKLRDRVVGASCADASSVMKRWSRQVNAAQEAFDKREYGY